MSNTYTVFGSGQACGPPPPAYDWDAFTASMAAEGQWELAGVEESEDAFYSANQYLIDTGLAWQLQGSFGRQAAALIDAGHCSPAA